MHKIYNYYNLLIFIIDFPAGVINMVFGLGPTAGEALVTHPEVPLVSFTGSTLTGKHIAQATAPMFKKLSLEVYALKCLLVCALREWKRIEEIKQCTEMLHWSITEKGICRNCKDIC